MKELMRQRIGRDLHKSRNKLYLQINIRSVGRDQIFTGVPATPINNLLLLYHEETEDICLILSVIKYGETN